MGLYFNNKATATGKAKCKVCYQFIKRGTKCIFVSGHHTSGYCHKNCRRDKND